MEKDYESGSLVPFDFSNIFKKIPEMKLIECEVSVHPFKKPLDSSDMGPNAVSYTHLDVYKRQM